MIALMWLIILSPFLFMLGYFIKEEGLYSALKGIFFMLLFIGGGWTFLMTLILLARYYMYGEAPKW